MRVNVSTDNAQCITSSSIEEYLASEQHRLNLVNQVTMEDMKTENRYYGNTVFTDRIPKILNPKLQAWKDILLK